MIQDFHGRPADTEINGSTVTEEEAAALYGIAIALRPQVIAEIGTGHGRSARAFDEAATYLNTVLGLRCHVWTCDTARRQKAAELLHTTFVAGDCLDLVREISTQPELIFIDGTHTTEASRRDYDVMVAFSPGATFIFHDANNEKDNVANQISGVVSELNGIILRTPYGLGIVQSHG